MPIITKGRESFPCLFFRLVYIIININRHRIMKGRLMKPYIWAVFACLTWGIVPILEKMGLAKIPIWAGICYRCVGIFIGLSLLVFFKFDEIKPVIVSMPKGWYFIALAGLMASIIGQIFFYNALKSGEASKIVPVAGSFPLVTFLLGVLFLKESVTASKMAGLMLILSGIFLLR